MDDVTDVVIVGAGPAGSSTAWHLAQLGVNVTLLDRAHFPRDKVCAEYLSPQASRLLAQMGVLETIEPAAAHLRGMRVRAPNGRIIHGSFAARHGFPAFRDRGLAVRRTLLDATLVDRARAAGVRVIEGTRVTDLTRDTQGRVSGAQVMESDGSMRTVSARLVIGADGLRSVVGRRLDLTRIASWPRRIALVAHYRDLPGLTDTGELHVERDGYVGIADVGNNLANVALVVPAAAAHEFATDRNAFLERWLASHPHLATRFAHATRIEPVRATGPFASSARQAWAPGAALVGDAADFFDPFTGEGVYAALRGGELLAPFAAGYLNASTPVHGDAALAEYERARRAEFSGKWTVERIIAGVVAVPALMNHAARALSRRTEMADLLIGVTGDFVPARNVLRMSYITKLLLFGI